MTAAPPSTTAADEKRSQAISSGAKLRTATRIATNAEAQHTTVTLAARIPRRRERASTPPLSASCSVILAWSEARWIPPALERFIGTARSVTPPSPRPGRAGRASAA